MATVFADEVVFNGTMRARSTVALPANCVGDSQVSASSPLAVEKVDHQYILTDGQNHGSAATAQRKCIHIARGAGTIVAFRVSQLVAAVGDSTVTIDLYKNGSSILTGTITINNGQAARALTSGTLSSSTVAADDVFEVVQTISAGTGTLPQGVTWQLTTEEAQ